MKLKYNLIAIALLGFSFSSCSDFLEQNPQTDLSENDFYKTADDILSAVNGAYSSLQEGDIYGNWYVFGEIPSDNTRNQLSGSVTTQNEFDQFYIDTQNSMIASFWKAAYKVINRTNTVLGRIDGIEINAELANRYKLECKFIRALMYFNLVRVYGDVPLVLKEISISESYDILREPKENVYNQIIADLKEAQGLPVSYSTAEDGRATQGAAKALLADVYMTLHKYAEAETILAEIINSGRYGLLENTPGSLNIDGYKNVFSPVNHNSKEGIFEIQFLKGGYGEGSNYANNFAPENSGTNVVAVGGTGGNNIPEMDIYNAYEEGDLRRDFSMSLGYYDNRKNNEWVESRYVCKFMDVPYQNNDASNNYPVIRYADVILMYAEALNQNGKTAEACKYLNMTRRRGFGYQTTETSPVDLQTTDKAQFALMVEQERRVELAFENHRWFDLIRTGRAVEVMKSKGFSLNETNLICPIPQKQIDVNPKLTQNDYKIESRN
ncbi:RagB/SusD family nutrient uptake outer membrane protein [Parabacteroides johnsonii]|jgi:tetratricopeptide (TPR) repeat protein|uniref:RagB/SusD family nutrient uptake outer membrane protein n=2 Tax=Parabacteroides johnsonii TaxID=387661 RepID=UPI001C8C33EE|nr:RagB/SusD family nutrient uptake outer membrane protein [Parabacteroides johnsonii]MBX9109835.1 RagB/SusD family nutrient uptake outer membrane protein [Parabacteroides johnsonii]MCS3052046.1 RagB/SusD family nutrient uptake outer membrane protein [Parabacteroides johnsonii]